MGSKLTRPLLFMFVRDGLIDIGLFVVAPCEAFWIAQEVAYQSEETADLLGVDQTVIGPQEYRHDIDRHELAGAWDHFGLYGSQRQIERIRFIRKSSWFIDPHWRRPGE
jgi:hypothetical protein